VIPMHLHLLFIIDIFPLQAAIYLQNEVSIPTSLPCPPSFPVLSLAFPIQEDHPLNPAGVWKRCKRVQASLPRPDDGHFELKIIPLNTQNQQSTSFLVFLSQLEFTE